MAIPTKTVTLVKLQILPGKATPAPPVGTALGPRGINIPKFCQEFNARSQGMGDDKVPVIITISTDKTFAFIIKQPPVPALIKRAAKLPLASKEPGRVIVGKITMAQARDIAKLKMADMGVSNLDKATLQVIGTARSMGIEVAKE